MRAQMDSGKVNESEKVPMLHRLLQYRYSSTNSMMPDHDIISEAMGHLLVARCPRSVPLLTLRGVFATTLGLPAPIHCQLRSHTSSGSLVAAAIS